MKEDLLDNIPEIQAYTTRTIVVSSFFGGIPAGCFMIYQNFKSFGDHKKARATILIAILAMIGIMATGFIPVLEKNAGFYNIGEKVVQHQARKYGVSKFGWERFINGFLDLLTITFLSKFGKRPMHFFGLIGTLMFVVGLCSTLYLGVDKAYHVLNHLPARLLTNRPSFFIALTSMILGTMLFLAGFIGELILRNSSDRNNYLLEKKINL